MFKKKPTIKTLAPLRSSDRRKIADQIIEYYRIEVPSKAEEEPSETPTQTIATIRNGLLPENTQSGRFTTTAGPDLQSVQGTIYVGTHPGSEERILWFKLEQGPGTDGRIYPTVYSLWHNPGLVPLLHTQSLVMEKLYGGADLMIPGLTNGPPFPERAVKNAVVAVADIRFPSVPTFVGVCEVDVSSLGSVQGAKGHAVRGIQWEGDELWSWSTSGRRGQPSPAELDGWYCTEEEPSQGLESLRLNENDATPMAKEDGEKTDLSERPEEDGTDTAGEPEKEPTTKEIDEVFFKAFLYALHQQREKNPSQPHHGFSFPIQPSFVISNLITPFLPIYSPQQAQCYQIKKTSWKNVKKFLKHLDKEKIAKTKDRSGGETVIQDVNFEDKRVSTFVPYKLPRKPGSENKSSTKVPAPTNAAESFDVKTLYRPSGKLVPDLFPPLANTDPNNFYSASDVSKHLNDYISSQNPAIISPANPRVVNLNPFISNKILSSNSEGDLAILSRGTIPRDAILRKLLGDPSLCAPYHAILKPHQSLKDVKPKAGALPKVTVILERRTRAKVVTRVMGLETFGVSPQMLGEELQKVCASSTSVSQAVGAAQGIMEVLVQGPQRQAVEKALGERGVKSQWIDVVDKTKPSSRR